ncbi:MAG: hypothetical protein ACI855_001777 [Myxococcota bacterium]|jgi:uncharacterized protein (TIGR02147 family)
MDEVTTPTVEKYKGLQPVRYGVAFTHPENADIQHHTHETAFMSLPEVFAYLDYRAFLKTWFEASKQADATYSYARFAEDGECSKSALANVIGGARRPKPSTVDSFSRAMDLSVSERAYLGLLVDLDAAATQSDRRAVMEQILSSERYGQVRLAEKEPDADIEQFLENWWIPAIRELAALPGFVNDAEWVAAQMIPAIEPAQAQAALDTLFQLDFLTEADGNVRQNEIHWRTEPEATQAAAARYHRVVLPSLMSTLDTSRSDQQHLVAATLVLDESVIAEVKATLNAVIQQLVNLGEDVPRQPGTRVYQLAIQLLPVSEMSVAVPAEPSS